MSSPEPTRDPPAPRVALIPRAELAIVLPLVGILNPSIAPAVLEARLADMIARGYECAGIWSGSDPMALAGGRRAGSRAAPRSSFHGHLLRLGPARGRRGPPPIAGRRGGPLRQRLALLIQRAS
jgi:hypothetical protein